MEKKLLYIVPETTVVAVKTSSALAVLSFDPKNDGVAIKNTSDPNDDLDPDNGDEILSKSHDVWEGWE